MKKSILFSFLSSVICILIIFSASSLLFAAPVKIETPVKIEAPVEQVWVRDHPMTCYQVWVNKDNNFEFVFWWEYKNNNWVKIYDMKGNEVFTIDMPFGDAHFIANLPDGMYTVKTFHDDFEKPIQEFIIGKPPAPEGEYDIVITDSDPPVFSESGFQTWNIYHYGTVSTVRNPWLLIGDSADNEIYITYLSYDITRFAGARILNVSLEFNVSNQLGDSLTLNNLVVYNVWDGWGEHPLSIGLYEQRLVQTISPVDLDHGNFTVSGDNLKSDLLTALIAGNSRFQLKVIFDGYSLNGISDAFEYNKNDIHLIVTYQRSLAGTDYR